MLAIISAGMLGYFAGYFVRKAKSAPYDMAPTCIITLLLAILYIAFRVTIFNLDESYNYPSNIHGGPGFGFGFGVFHSLRMSNETSDWMRKKHIHWLLLVGYLLTQFLGVLLAPLWMLD